MLCKPKQLKYILMISVNGFTSIFLTYQMGIYIVLSIGVLLWTFWVYINPLFFLESSLNPFSSYSQNLLSTSLLQPLKSHSDQERAL